MKNILFYLLVSSFSFLSNAQQFISFASGTTTQGSSWKYLDNGTDLGSTWTNASFNDSAWQSGNSELGYGETDQNTTLSFGSDANNKFITSYFRKTINIPNVAAFLSFTINVKRDDGIVVYVNGSQVFIDNISAGPAYNTLATTAASDDGNGVLSVTIPSAQFVSGNNIIAVEIHQAAINSSDISFDMELIGNTHPIISRGPYLQLGTIDGVTIRWRTDTATDSKVTWGTVFGTYPNVLTNSTLTTEHSLRINGLLPDTKYYYTIGNNTIVFQAGINNNFLTLPIANTTRKMKFLALGDCGANNTNQLNVRNSTKNFIGTNDIDAMILLGDNAYSNGTDAEYQTNFFDIYKDDFLKYYKLYPAPGNHDYGSSANTGLRNLPYHLSFTVPQNAEIGGVASGVSNYYSYNIGNVHFVSLDSYGQDDGNTTKMYDVLGTQAQWLVSDLQANTQKWTIVYFHHPPYTKTSHSSDLELDLVAVREKFIRILEQNGVDLVLCGHSHGYERSYLLKEFYNNFAVPLNDSDFNANLHTATGNLQNAIYDGSTNSCGYAYNSGRYNHGTVYVVSGSAGQLGGASAGYPQNCMYYSNNTDGGSFYFEVQENRLDAKFISYNSSSPTVPVVRDSFTVFKDVNKITNLTVEINTASTLTASWIGTYNWTTTGNQNTRQIIVPNDVLGTFSYQVKDTMNCITDIYNITVAPALSNDGFEKSDFMIYPNPSSDLIFINSNTNFISYNLKTIDGKTIASGMINENNQIDIKSCISGIYLLYLNNDNKTIVRKIIKE